MKYNNEENNRIIDQWIKDQEIRKNILKEYNKNKIEKEETLKMLIEMEQMKRNKIHGLHEMLEIKEKLIKKEITLKEWEKELNNTTATKEKITKDVKKWIEY